MNTIDVGNKISTIRKEKGWTQKDIAEKLHVSTAAVSKWERGLNYPDLSLMEPLAELLEISVTELLGVADEAKDNIIRNIAEISQEEKEREMFSVRKRAALIIGTIAVFFLVVILVLVVGSNKESSGMLSNLTGSGLLEIIPLILGFLSWGLALAGTLLGKGKLKEKWKSYSIVSLVLSSIALYFPILIIDCYMRNGNIDTVTDTVWGYHYGSAVLLIGVLLFNGLSWKLNKK